MEASALRLALTVNEELPEELILKSTSCSKVQNGNKLVVIYDSYLECDTVRLLNITALNLSRSNIELIPKAACKLKNLKTLNLSHNKLQDPPECLEMGLKFIEHLDLSHNNLIGFEREPLCRKRLKVLLLNNNNLLNIPEWILYVRCLHLEEFNYSYNEVNRLYASQFNVRSDYKLKKLELQSCFIFERDFKYINTIKTLQYLNVSNDPFYHVRNTISGEMLFRTPAFSETLQVLNLNHLNLSILSEQVACLSNLRELYLTANNLTWLPESIVTLNRLEVLDVSQNSVAFLPDAISEMRTLKKLIAPDNSIPYLPDISKMPALRYLDLYNNSLTDFTCDMTSFTHLDLENNFFDTKTLLDYHNYVQKRENLRTSAAVENRACEPKSQPEGVLSVCTTSSRSSLSSEHEDLVQVGDEEEELWDAPDVPGYVRECTLSDDEWMGSEPPLVLLRKTSSRAMHQDRATTNFSDAEEDPSFWCAVNKC